MSEMMDIVIDRPDAELGMLIITDCDHVHTKECLQNIPGTSAGFGYAAQFI
jgi:hypothetical protein